MTSFWLELKSICRSFRFLALILVLLAYQFVFLAQFQAVDKVTENKETQVQLVYKRKTENWVRYWQTREREYLKTGQARHGHSPTRIALELNWYRAERSLATALLESAPAKAGDVYHSPRIEKLMLNWTLLEIPADKSNINVTFLSPEVYFGPHWETYEPLAPRPDTSYLPVWLYKDRDLNTVEYTALATDYHLQLLTKDLPLVRASTSPWAFLFNFLRKGLPTILPILVLLMTANMLHREKKFGAIKTNLLRPKSRCRYLLRKASLGIVANLLLVTIPQLVMFTFMAAKHGLAGFNLPVLIKQYAFDWAFTCEYSLWIKWIRNFRVVGLSQYAPSSSGQAAAELGSFIPLWQFLAIAGVVLILFIAFCSLLGILISTLIKNEIAAQIVALGAFGIGAYFGNLLPSLKLSCWDLFARAEAISLLEGNQYTTYWQALVVLGAAILLLFSINVAVFKKQDIASN